MVASPGSTWRLLVVAVVVVVLGAACSSPSTTVADERPEPRPLTSEEADRLALSAFRSYQAGTRRVEAAVADGTGVVQVQGWIDTVEHRGYGMVAGPGVEPFLAAWTTETLQARPFEGVVPPLPAPQDGWEDFTLDPTSSFLAAAQVLLVSLADDRPKNAQLLRQDGATWLRRDRISDRSVDVMGGPVPKGATASSYRYWIDEGGELLRLEARLDGERWSTFDFFDAPDVDLGPPAEPEG